MANEKDEKKPPTLQIVTTREKLFKFKMAALARQMTMTELGNELMDRAIAEHEAQQRRGK